MDAAETARPPKEATRSRRVEVFNPESAKIKDRVICVDILIKSVWFRRGAT